LPAARVSRQELDARLAPLVVETARQISWLLGQPGPAVAGNA
jgi:DNA-binding IclR family transcriptional regulator